MDETKDGEEKKRREGTILKQKRIRKYKKRGEITKEKVTSTDKEVLANKEHWKKMFQTLAEKNREKNGEKVVLGAVKHVERIVGTRQKLREQESRISLVRRISLAKGYRETSFRVSTPPVNNEQLRTLTQGQERERESKERERGKLLKLEWEMRREVR